MIIEKINFDSQLLGDKIGTGATADVYAYGAAQIAKIFHPNMNYEYVEHEYSSSKAIEETGLPVPHTFGICTITNSNTDFNDCHAIIQERISGTSVMRLILEYNKPEDFPIVTKLISQVVELQVQINKVDAGSMNLPKQKDILHYFISIAPLLTDEEKQHLYALLNSLPSGNNLCHCDYHFDNIFSTDNGLVCFDWCDAMCGNPTADLARSLLIFHCEETPDSIPPEVKEQIAQLRSVSIPFYRDTYVEKGGSIDHLDAWMAIVAAGRLKWEVDGNKPAMLRVVRNYLNTSKR